MTFRRLPQTVREVLSRLERELGKPGLIFGLIALPLVLLAAIVSYPFIALSRRRGAGRVSPHRTLELTPGGVFFSWAGDAVECRSALAAAVAALVDSLPKALSRPELRTLEVRNPETGFALAEDRLGKISTEHAATLVERLWGEKLEYGELVVDGDESLRGFDVDARSHWSGHLAIELNTSEIRDALRLQAGESGFMSQG